MLNIINLTKQYKEENDKRGVSDISFSISKGEIICILGSSGSGKTTLLRLISGLEKPDSGEINYTNDINIGYVAQDYTLWPHLTVLENITLAPILKGKDIQKTITEAKKLLQNFELEEYSGSYPIDLSGGQKQRVALLRAIIVRPEILLLDEVTSALDPILVKSILDLIKKLAKEDYTMLIVTHHISFAQSVADRIIFLKDGSILQNEKTTDFFNNQNNREIIDFIKEFKEKDF